MSRRSDQDDRGTPRVPSWLLADEEHALRWRGAGTSQARSTHFAGEERAHRRRGARTSQARSRHLAGEEHALRRRGPSSSQARSTLIADCVCTRPGPRGLLTCRRRVCLRQQEASGPRVLFGTEPWYCAWMGKAPPCASTRGRHTGCH